MDANQAKPKVDFSISYLNTQGMVDKDVLINEFSNDNIIDILCISEHWCREEELSYKVLDDYTLINSYSRKHHLHGGVAIYVKTHLAPKCSKLDLGTLCDELHFETSGLLIECLRLLVVVVYRSPNGDPHVFLEKLEDLLVSLCVPKWGKYKIVIGGDVNASFDISQDKKSVSDLKNILRQFNLYYVNCEPTRGSACLDNVFKIWIELVCLVI